MSAEHKKRKNKSKKNFSKPRTSAPKASGTFKESIFDSLGDDLAGKLRKSVEENQKKKIRKLMSNPKVQQASKEFAKDTQKK
ncbi:MAG: hypothetical protein GX801_02730 [Fibrobacter sp.]|nr:hypothetical protein [Fibrobacter sp.]